MWIRTKDKLINTRHLAEIKITSAKVVNGTIHELSACPARKENQNSVLYKDSDRKKVEGIFIAIAESLEREDKEYKVPENV